METIEAAWTGRIVLWLVLSPFVGAVLLVFVRRQPPAALRSVAIVNALCTALIATGLHVWALGTSDPEHPTAAVIEWTWLTVPRAEQSQSDPWLEVVLTVGYDNLSAAPLLWIPWLALSALLAMDDRLDELGWFYSAFFAWEGCLLECVAAYDALTFLGCETVALWLGYVLTSGWGQADRRAAAAKFWRQQFAGQAAWWTGLVALGVVAAWCRYDVLPVLPTLKWTWPALALQLPLAVSQSWGAAQYWQSISTVLFLVLAFGALMRTPVVPLHSWLPKVVGEAPSAVAVLICATWCPLGMYAWLRFVAPVFSESALAFSGELALLGGATAVYGGLCALAATDLRRFGAYALLSLQGVAWLSASTGTIEGYRSAWLMSQAAGVSSAAWLILAALWERRCSSREWDMGAGLAERIPRFVVMLAAIVIGVCGFPSLGRLAPDLAVGWTLAQQRPWGLAAALFGWLMVGWSAVRLLERCSCGRHSEPAANQTFSAEPVRDISWRECVALLPLFAWCVWSWCQPPSPFADQRVGTGTPTLNPIVHHESPQL